MPNKWNAKPGQSVVLVDLEKLIGQSISLRDTIASNTIGVKVAGGEIIDLSLYNCHLTTLPESFGDLKSLQELDLGANQLTTLPESFGGLISLQELNLNVNKLTTLPESFGQLQSLQTLDLRSNHLTTLPESFGQLQSLQTLMAPHNQLTVLPESFGDLKSLQTLDLEGNQLTALPESFGNLKSLQKLEIYFNKLTTLPEPILELKNLQILDLGGNKLTTLPESFGALKSLTWLNLNSNKLTTLPESFGDLKSLQTLSLNDNQLTTLPESFGDLKSLQTLGIYSNQLTALPESFGQLKSLQTLNLSYNQLTALPESFGELKSLQKLDIQFNKLRTLPESFWQLKNLKTLSLDGNPWTKEWKELGTYSAAGLLTACRQRARITLFISHAKEDRDRYHVKNLVEELKKRTERERGGEIREVYITGEEKIPESQLVLFIATRNSLEDRICQRELGLALTHMKKIIPLKGEDLKDWKDLKPIDLREGGHGYLNLGTELGVAFDHKPLEQFCDELYDYIKQYKRKVNLFETREEALDNLKITSENIIRRFIKSEKFKEYLKDRQTEFEDLRNKLEAEEISIREFIFQCDHIFTRNEE